MNRASAFAQRFLMRPEFAIPAKAGIQGLPRYLPAWMPAFAGMTVAAGGADRRAKPRRDICVDNPFERVPVSREGICFDE